MNPEYPIFIPTKGRYESALTIKAFEAINVPFRAVVQPQEYDKYAAVIRDKSQIIVLPSDIDGLVPTRNWIWDYAQSLGVSYFWTFDDNIRRFMRLHKNQKLKLTSGTFLKVIEDFAARYENLAITGMQYAFFAKRKQKLAPLVFNTRVYSNMLIKTDIPFRNRGVYNDDTDLCLQVLKSGWCVVEFQAFLIEKMATMTVKGGNTPIYQGDGRLKMAEELQRAHPDVVKVVWKFNRWQHQVDYSRFKYNKLIKRTDIEIPDEPNEYGMKLVQKDTP